MDLIGEDQHPLLQADGAELLQLLPTPHPAHRVVGAAEEEDLSHLRRLGKAVKVHLVAAVPLQQGTLQHLAAIPPDGAVEGVVHRREHDDLVPRLGIGLDHMAQGGHHPRGGHHPLPLDLPAVASGHPALQRLIVAVGGLGVAQNGLLQVVRELLRDLRRIDKLHVRHGQGDHLRREVWVEPLHGRPLAGAHGDPGAEGGKVIGHNGHTSWFVLDTKILPQSSRFCNSRVPCFFSSAQT